MGAINACQRGPAQHDGEIQVRMRSGHAGFRRTKLLYNSSTKVTGTCGFTVRFRSDIRSRATAPLKLTRLRRYEKNTGG